MMSMDRCDNLILDLLREKGRMSSRELWRELFDTNISWGQIRHALKRLQQERRIHKVLILGRMAVPDYELTTNNYIKSMLVQ